MIDMHCHIIPEVDDGSKNINETIEMAKRAIACGYSGIFATSHFMDDNFGVKKKEIESSVFAINKILKEKNINIEVYTGNEVYFRHDILNLIDEGIVSTLANSKYILIELPMNGEAFGVETVLNSLLQRGYVPIIAHPERYSFVQKNIKKLSNLIKEGVLLQCNISSIIGVYGNSAKATIKKLLKNDMVHLFGTDAHSTISAYDNFEKATKKIKKIVGEKRYNQIFNENPAIILKDSVLDVWKPKIK